MYTDSNLYYLNQLGIVPWVKKQSATKLLILLNQELSDKEEGFLQQLVDYLCVVEKNTVQWFCADKKQLLSKFQSAEKVLNLGINESEIKSFQLKGQVFSCYSIPYYIENPLNKKQLFLSLNLLKQTLIN